eukprot:EG_transcript_26063
MGCGQSGGNRIDFNTVTPKHTDRFRVFMDVFADQERLGRLELELRGDVAPKTAENFRQLCTGEGGLSYKRAKFHRIVPGFVAQGGDFTRGDGTGSTSIYGKRFPDENFDLKHEGFGDLSMANTGKDTNGSQFFISFAKNSNLDNKHVVFGKVVGGLDVLKVIESYGTKGPSDGRPKKVIRISDCGEL